MLFFLNVIYKSFLKLFPSKHTHLVNFVKWWIWCFVVEAFCTKHYLWQYLFRHTWWLKSDITCDWIYLAWTAVQKPVLMFFTKNAFIWIKNSETEKLWNIRGVTIRVSCIERFTGSSKWKWSSLSPWSGDFGVNGTCVSLCSRLECTWWRERNFLIIFSWDVPVTTQHGVRQQMSLIKCQMYFYCC